MPEELDAVVAHLAPTRTLKRAGRTFIFGDLWGVRVVVVFSRWGKVAAASTATELIVSHGVSRLVLCGIAGGLSPRVRRGDIVVADALVQHDLDASPFFPPTVVPLTGVREFKADPAMSSAIEQASGKFLADDLSRAARSEHVAALPPGPRRVIRGVVATGDQVIMSESARRGVLERVPAALGVEMEGAAVAQVCHEHALPFACVRAISDGAGDAGVHEIRPFFDGLAGVYTAGVLARWLASPEGRAAL